MPEKLLDAINGSCEPTKNFMRLLKMAKSEHCMSNFSSENNYILVPVIAITNYAPANLNLAQVDSV